MGKCHSYVLYTRSQQEKGPSFIMKTPLSYTGNYLNLFNHKSMKHKNMHYFNKNVSQSPSILKGYTAARY